MIGTYRKGTSEERETECTSESVEALVTVRENKSRMKEIQFVSIEISRRCL